MPVRIMIIAALLVALLAAPCRSWAQSDIVPADAMPAAPTAPADNFLPIVVGGGASAGVGAFNWLALGVTALPGGFG